MTKFKINHTNKKQLIFHKENSFWVAYQQSAYYLAQLMGFEAIKKFNDELNQEVVSVVFPDPEIIFEVLVVSLLFEYAKSESDYIEINLIETIDYEAFENWKIIVPFENQLIRSLLVSVEDKVKAFPLAKKTPMEAFLFLKELQKEQTPCTLNNLLVEN